MQFIPISEGTSPYAKLYVAGLQGGNRRLLVFAHDYVPFAAWSPDGSRLYYETLNASSPSVDFTFWSTATDASGAEVLTRGLSFLWGPSGSYAVLRGGLNTNTGTGGPLIFVDASGRERVISTARAGPVAISPSGELIVYATSDAQAPYGSLLHVARTDGSGDVGIAYNASDAAFSPGGRRLAFVTHSLDPSTSDRLVVADARASNPRVVVRPTASYMRLEAPHWSPNGRRIVFIRQSGSNRTVEIVGADGRGRHAVSPHSAGGIWWAPDGRRIYFDTFG